MPKVSTYTLLAASGIDRANDSLYIVDATGPSSKRATVAGLWDAGLPGAHVLLGDVTVSGSFNWTWSGLSTITLGASTIALAGLVQIQLPLGNTATQGQPLLLASSGASGLVAWGNLQESFIDPVNVTITAGRALTDSDHGDTLVYSGSSNITLTAPASLRSGFFVRVVAMGTGAITFAAGSGATVNGPQGQLSTGHQYATAELRKVTSTAFVAFGNLGNIA